MAYNCGQCMIDFPTKKQVIEHVHEKHSSPYLEGEWAATSKDMLQKEKAKGNAKADSLLAKFDE